jgi:hypothetical protein
VKLEFTKADFLTLQSQGRRKSANLVWIFFFCPSLKGEKKIKMFVKKY